MSDKTPEQIIALAKQCGAGGYGDRLLAFTPGELQAFAAALTAARPDKQLQWTEKTEDGERSYSFPLEGATQLLADLYKEWPGGLEEIASALRTKAAQPAQPAKQQSQPTNIAPCEVLRNHGKCWRNACVVAGACTAPLVQATKQPSQAVMPPISPQAERALKECRDCFVTYDGPTSDANELARYVLELQAAWPQPVQPATKGDKP